jgi:hypothetical protein
MSEAYIKILNDYLDGNDGKLVSKKRFKFLQAIENLMNKYKEQEKVIELMAEDIAHNGFDEDICRAFKQEDRPWECDDDRKCKLCIIEYYEKKAKGD